MDAEAGEGVYSLLLEIAVAAAKEVQSERKFRALGQGPKRTDRRHLHWNVNQEVLGPGGDSNRQRYALKWATGQDLALGCTGPADHGTLHVGN